jgi:hypothetical protein
MEDCGFNQKNGKALPSGSPFRKILGRKEK